MINPFDRSARTAPSSYPRVPFHGVRALQLLSSLVVGGIMCFFIWHLTHDHWNTPWTFIWLTAASLFSVASLFATILLHCFTGLNPRLNLALNALLALLWALSWSLLTWYMSGVLANVCDVAHWNEAVGVMVCRIYKALFAFTLLGLISTLAALALDFHVRRQQTRRGVYRLHDLDGKRPAATRGPFTDADAAEPRESEAWEAPRPSMGPYSEQGEKQAPQQGGYAVPEQQFEYDTAYSGGHSERVFGASRAV
ncbi:hypothetical protein LTR08_007200 [Meristemomyces frigidus]|nr:hypothetical protein LTR08_007200 [Meristemomyces frigidus]